MVGAQDRHLSGFERLAQRVESLRLEFRQLVEEEHSVVRERYFAWPRMQAAGSGESRHEHFDGLVARQRL